MPYIIRAYDNLLPQHKQPQAAAPTNTPIYLYALTSNPEQTYQHQE
jgi:hypothetical protein